jgi:hypothetical protein
MMRPTHSTRQRGLGRAWRGEARVAAALFCAALLSGCSSFGTSGTPDAPAPSRFPSLFSGSSRPDASNPLFNPNDCPPLEIRTGAGTLTVAGKPPQTSAADVRYQVSFGDLARQCIAVGSTLTVKVGVQVRIILGPAGEAGPVDIPLRYAVVSEGPNPRTIFTQFKRLAFDVQPGQDNVATTDIQDVSVPIPPREELMSYVVYVGFDSMGDEPEKKPPPKKKPAPKRK